MTTMRSPLMSPVTPAAGSRVPVTPVEFITPSVHRQASIAQTTNSMTSTTTLYSMRDDAHERKERRRSRLLEMQRRNLTSPATPTDKRKSMSTPSAGLTAAQLTDHYANCIKLSAENKINAKNAFGLHLIDYLSEFLKKKEMNNFQVASSSLDASAKIYACRVDAIHSETYKVLTGLGRGSDRRKSVDEGGADAGEPDVGKKKQKRSRKKAAVETNIKNLNVNKFDLEFEVDPLFQKASATFDEGGSGGLLLSHMHCLDDTSAIVYDMNTVVTGVTDGPGEPHEDVDLTELRDLYHGMDIESLNVCPAFADFSFTNWTQEKDGGNTTIISRMAKESEHRFNLDGEVEQIVDAMDDNDLDAGQDLPVDDFTGNDDDYVAPECDTVTHLADGSTVIKIGDSREARLVESVMTDLMQGSIGSIKQVLTADRNEYTYLPTHILNSWAGPDHWKLKPKSKEDKVESKTGEEKESRKRKRKEPRQLESEIDDSEFEKALKETRASSELTKRTLTNHSKMATTLPEVLQYNTDDLLTINLKPRVMIRRLEMTNDIEDAIDRSYDYNNDNDKENFVPLIQDDDDDDMPVDDVFDEAAGGDHTEGRTLGFDLSAGDGLSQSQGVTPSQEDATGLNTTVFRGDNMVEQPHKVAKIDIGYARTAKRVDVKRLKNSMWTLLCTPEEEASSEVDLEPSKKKGKESEPSTSEEKSKEVAGKHKFSQIVKSLPNTISKNMAKNLSVPIAFVCLLHLANEKTLKIDNDEDMSDLIISQG